MKKRNLTFAILLVAVMVTAAGVSQTYARYVTNLTGTAKADVAKWAVAFKNGDAAISNNFTLTLTDDDTNAHVADGKIAPDSELYGLINVDLAGTEVSTDIVVQLGEITGLPTGGTASADDFSIKLYNGNTEVTTKDSAGNPIIHVDLAGRAALTTTNNLTLKVVLTWTNNEAHNASDTVIGTTDQDITASLTLTAKQHVKSDAAITG